MSLSLAQRKVLQDYVQAGSGLSDGLVRWGRPKGGAMPPTGMWISMRVEGSREVSPGVLKITPAPSPAPGADLLFTQEIDKRATLVLECFVGEEGWHVEVPPDRVLSRVVDRRNLPLVGQALREGGIGFGPVEEVDIIDLERTATMDSRAMVRMVIFYAQADVSELGTSIQHVEMEATVNETIVETILVDAPEDP